MALQLAILAEWHHDQPAKPDDVPQEGDPPPMSSPQSSTTGLKRKSPFDGGYTDAELEIPDITFDASRDCRGGMHCCCHCNHTFGDHIGLKRHIEKQRCPKFQANRPPQLWILQYQAPVRTLIQNLHPEQWLVGRDFIQRLQQECALWGRQFNKDEFLVQHLALEHRRGRGCCTIC